MSKFAVGYAMKKKMAKGGEMRSGFVDHEGDDVKHDKMAMMEDDKMLGQHGAKEHGPMGAYAKGGEVDHEADMVHRILKKCYSEGGQVANGGDDDLDRMADGAPNNFDDLALRDDLESSYDGDNAGDHLGNEQEDEDRHDIVKRIMKSQAKKDRMPRPA